MDPVIRALAVYAFMLLMFRILGKRSLGEITTFDFILLLIIGEATQQALLGDDFSVTNALIIISVLIAADYGLSRVAGRFPAFDRLLEGVPLIVVAEGRCLTGRLKRAGLSEEDILIAAREAHGLERLDQIKYAVQERDGRISIIPRD